MNLAWIDLLGLGLLGAFLILGFVRGLWWQVIRLVGVVAAVLIARAASPTLAPKLVAQWPDLQPRLAHGIAWFGIFLAAMIAATVLGLLGKRLLQAMQLGLFDRVGGAAVGAATGLLVHVAVLVAIVQLGSEPFVARTISGTTSEHLVDALGARWPVVLGRDAGGEVDDLLRRARLAPEGSGEVPRGIVR